MNLWLAGLLALPALLAAMILWITWQNRRTRHWQATVGRIVESRNAARDVRARDSSLIGRSDGGAATVVSTDTVDRKNFADIAYEYAVAGRTYTSPRVAPGADPGNLDVVALLQRYPRGKVVTVHYDPAAPGDSILERDDPRRLRAAWLGVAVLTAVIVGVVFAVDPLVAWVRMHTVNPRRVPLVMAALVAALFFALLAWASLRRTWTMRGWPTADGIVHESRVERLATRRTRGGRTTATPFYVPRVIYRFRVGGIDIDAERFGRSVRSTTFAVVERVVAAFPVGTRVAVHYDPDEPTTAVVAPTAGALPLVLAAIAALLAAVAWTLAAL